MSKIQPQASGTRIAQIRTTSWTERPQDLAIDMFIFLGMCKLLRSLDFDDLTDNNGL